MHLRKPAEGSWIGGAPTNAPGRRRSGSGCGPAPCPPCAPCGRASSRASPAPAAPSAASRAPLAAGRRAPNLRRSETTASHAQGMSTHRCHGASESSMHAARHRGRGQESDESAPVRPVVTGKGNYWTQSESSRSSRQQRNSRGNLGTGHVRLPPDQREDPGALPRCNHRSCWGQTPVTSRPPAATPARKAFLVGEQ